MLRLAGTFGYQAEHYEVSKAMAELSLLPALRQATEALLVGRRHQLPTRLPTALGERPCTSARVLFDRLA